MFRTLILGAACVGFGLALSATAHARPSHSATEERPPAEEVSPVRPVAAVVPEGHPSCIHPRRRLWLEGEGWVVRKVAACR